MIKPRFFIMTGVFTVLILLFLFYQPGKQSSDIHAKPDTAFSDTLSADDDSFERALQPRKFSFPKDHGAHNRYRTEWWYFTGNLEDPKPCRETGNTVKKTSKRAMPHTIILFTRLASTGTVRIGKHSLSLSGSSWMDREWSTSSLSTGQSGWDWFALQLTDNTEIMFYQFRRKDGLPDPNSYGAVFLADNSKIPLKQEDVSINNFDYWQSPHSDIRYPSGWHLTIPGQGIELDVMPLIKDQELNTRFRYWEVAVAISNKNRSGKFPVKDM